MLPFQFHFFFSPLAIYWGKGGWLCPMTLSSYTTDTSSNMQLKTETIFLHPSSFSLPLHNVYQAVVVSSCVKTEKGYPPTCSLCERNAYVTIRNQYPICYSIYGGALCASSRWYILDVKWCKGCLLGEDKAREVRRPSDRIPLLDSSLTFRWGCKLGEYICSLVCGMQIINHSQFVW